MIGVDSASTSSSSVEVMAAWQSEQRFSFLLSHINTLMRRAPLTRKRSAYLHLPKLVPLGPFARLVSVRIFRSTFTNSFSSLLFLYIVLIMQCRWTRGQSHWWCATMSGRVRADGLLPTSLPCSNAASLTFLVPPPPPPHHPPHHRLHRHPPPVSAFCSFLISVGEGRWGEACFGVGTVWGFHCDRPPRHPHSMARCFLPIRTSPYGGHILI